MNSAGGTLTESIGVVNWNARPVRVISTLFDLQDPLVQSKSLPRNRTVWTEARRAEIGHKLSKGESIVCRTYDELCSAVRIQNFLPDTTSADI